MTYRNKRNFKPFEGEYKVTKLTPERPISITFAESQKFYESNEWKTCKHIFYSSGKEKKCNKCGCLNDLQIDHILPVRRYWEKRLSQSNLQFLCAVCNKEKRNDVGECDAVFNRPYLSDGPYHSYL